jgi:hypothetical protein
MVVVVDVIVKILPVLCLTKFQQLSLQQKNKRKNTHTAVTETTSKIKYNIYSRNL